MRNLILGVGLALVAASPAGAAQTIVAVAANFTKPAEEIAAAFHTSTGDTVVLSFGATGALYSQIAQAAPFTVFLAADDQRPAQAVSDGLGVAGSVFTYSIGRLALYSPMLDVSDGEAVLRDGQFQHLAIAEPRAAHYGAAAMEVIGGLGLAEALGAKLVTGENITQTWQFVESGNAEIGFVALSQVVEKPVGQVWRVPAELYAPIRQDAVLLKAGENDPVALAFMAFLRGDTAQAIIKAYGYGTAAD